MASGFKSNNGQDLDDRLELRQSGDAQAPSTNYRVGSSDLNLRYARASVGDPGPVVGFRRNGEDIGPWFAAKGSRVTAVLYNVYLGSTTKQYCLPNHKNEWTCDSWADNFGFRLNGWGSVSPTTIEGYTIHSMHKNWTSGYMSDSDLDWPGSFVVAVLGNAPADLIKFAQDPDGSPQAPFHTSYNSDMGIRYWLWGSSMAQHFQNRINVTRSIYIHT